MKLRLSLLIALVLAALIAGVGRADAAGGAHYYLALGDSLVRSAQPNGDFQHGYSEQLLALLQQQDPSLRLVKLGCGGATTAASRHSRARTAPERLPRCCRRGRRRSLRACPSRRTTAGRRAGVAARRT
jgi:hypothetical protein